MIQSTECSTENFPRQLGVEPALWVPAAKKADKWDQGILEAAERFMAWWYVEEGEKSSERRCSPSARHPKAKKGEGE